MSGLSFKGIKSITPLAAAPKAYIGDITTTTITLGDVEAPSAPQQQATVVGKAGLPHGATLLTETEVELSAAEDPTTNAAWSHLWKDLPKTDAEGNTLYYYVVETGATVHGSTVNATYERTPATSTEPETITITNTVEVDQKYGSLKVTKELTGVTTDNWWTKPFKFTLKDSNGKYLNATSHEWQDGTDGAEFTVTPSTAIQFDHLPVGNYIITETSTAQELALSAYEYDETNSVKGTDAEGITVTETNTSEEPAVFKLENKYTPKETSVVVTKVWENADGSTTPPPGASVTFELFRNDSAMDPVKRITLDGTVDIAGEVAAWAASWTNLPAYDDNETAYSYTVKEIVTGDYGWNHYLVSYPKDGTTQEEKTSASSGESITNKERTTDLTVDKKWFADAASAEAGTPEKEPSITTIHYKVMQKLGEKEATVYSYNDQTVQSLTYDSTEKDWIAVTLENLPVKVYVEDTENPENSAWLDAAYYVVECDSTGAALNNEDYEITYQKNDGTASGSAGDAAITGTDSSRKITIINTDTFVPIEILKVDANDYSKALTGAEFKLWKKNTSGSYVVDTSVGTNGVFTVDAYGKAEISVLAGEYKIEETKAPDGYIISADSTFYFTVSGGVVTYTDEQGTAIGDDSGLLVKYTPKTSTDPAVFKVGNIPGAALPNAGGIGTTIFYILGAILAFGAGVLLVGRRVRSEE